MPAVRTSGGNAAFHNFVNDFADIEDPLERRRLALEKIDNAKFGWYHIRAICVAGVGFMTDSYDLFSINLSVPMLAHVFWNGTIPTSTETLLKVSTSVGTVFGQLGFGWLADVLGRKKIYGTELIIMICATILQVTAGESPSVSFPAILTFYRIIMGIGIGGDYPLSSIITSEFATTKWRGAIMGAVFANQGWGQLFSGIVAIICVAAYKNDLIGATSSAMCDATCKKACDEMWRILIGFGALPGCIALYFRLTIPESPRYTFDVANEAEKATADAAKFASGKHGNAAEGDIEALKVTVSENAPKYTPPTASFKDFWGHFGQWRYGKILIGTAGCWFMLDISYYGLGLNTASILKTIGFASSSNVYHSLFNQSAGNLILICAGSIPGYWCSVATLDVIGRKPIQIGGFLIMTILFCIIGFAYNKLSDHGLLALYVLCQFFQNFGPNTTTFIVPGECYPTRYRSTAHGISAASGKIGAIIAQTCIGTLQNHNCKKEGKPTNCWLPHVMEIFGLFMLVGFFLSFLIPETKRKTLEQLSEELHGEIDITKQEIRAGSSDDTGLEKVQ
ncbi:Inorganic phosphate transporter pho84 [Brettanomyces nanus]|uniref:Inorganic phosphate transporter pho84 n=1 Tax=Eeniella nana TaxID=13502 RepID=A0A875RZW3_EENNA|nr:Inorganic phosphate transporter pho84 [Brettanomyces nanus]QPG74268.1 Inorganic phosphate transporter pho84 [Brettanomyces nanus]